MPNKFILIVGTTHFVILGAVFLVLGGAPRSPLSQGLAFYVAMQGGAFIVLAAVRFLLTFRLSWIRACVAGNIFALMQLAVVSVVVVHPMVHLGSAMLAFFGVVMMVFDTLALSHARSKVQNT